MKAKKITELAFLTTIALIIFMIELQIPNLVPIPGIKLGLANVITVYAVYHYWGREVLMVVISRIFLGTIFAGNIMALAYSLVGAALCLMGMLFLKKVIPENHIWLCSVFGAVLHNIGQIGVAVLITRTPAVAAYLPCLLVSGCIAGAFTGCCAQFVIKRSRMRDFRRGGVL